VAGLLVAWCFNDAKKKKRKENNLLCFYFFWCVFVALHVMTKEVGEIVFEMEKNLNNPMRTLQKLCGSNFYKMIGKGDFGEVMR
jgi:hypothetical protein